MGVRGGLRCPPKKGGDPKKGEDPKKGGGPQNRGGGVPDFGGVPPPPLQVLKLGGAVLEAGRQLVGSSRALAVGLREMGGAPRRDPLLKVRTPLLHPPTPPTNIFRGSFEGGDPKIEGFGGGGGVLVRVLHPPPQKIKGGVVGRHPKI